MKPRPKHAPPEPAETLTFRELLKEAPTIPWSGRGLSESELPMWRETMVLATLTTALARQETFWDQVEAVRGGGSPHDIAARYTRGAGRLLISHFSPSCRRGA